MPYDSIADLPDNVKALPAHAKEIYMKAFNSAFEQYKDRGDQREALSHATAWAAVEKSYKKRNGRWVAREAKMLSDKNKRNLLQSALVKEYGLKDESPIPKNLSIEEVFDEELTYDIDGQAYKASYKLDENGNVVIGEPEKVLKQIVYKAMESLQTTYSEILQEAGRRNAKLDASRVKKIVELCQELLSSEDEPEEKKAKEALKEAKAVLKIIQEQAVMKTEDGLKFPAAAYAYVPDVESSSTWKLRLWEDLTKKVTRKQLGAAAAALSPGGFRGQKVAITAADLGAVKRKIRAEYRKLDVEDEDIPRWVKEVETRERILNYMPLTEAKFDKGRATVVVIKAGFNATEDRYYPVETLKRDYKVFEGMKMYADHPTEEEDKARPERSIKDWVATLTEVTCDENGVVTGIADVIEPWMMQKLAALREKQMLSEMGISINAIGHATKATIEGKETLVIEELTACRSVDFVTEPGAGGIVTLYESDRSRDVDLVELSELKEKRPDLVKLIEANIREEIKQEVKRMSEQDNKITELESQIESLTTERDQLKEATEQAERAQKKAEAQAVIKEAVEKAELPDAAKERILDSFKDAESADGVEEAITTEKDYISKLSEAGKVKGLGRTQADSDKDKKALKESFKKTYIAQGESEEEAEKLAESAVSGR